MRYKLYCTNTQSAVADAVICFKDDGSLASFIFDEQNSDYQAYLKWLEEGNTPEPADQGAQE